MRTLYTSLQRPIAYIFSGLFALVLTSCGTYYSAGYEEDGIYASNEVETEVEETSNAKSSYYKQYFQSKDKSYEDLPEDGVIFTDIDAYSTTESLDEEGNIVVEEREIAYEDGYGGWGTNNSDVIVNVYNTAGWGGGWGLGWGGWGFNAGWGWNNPWWGWGYGYRPFWGWGGGYWGWGGGWWCPPNAWGGFYGNPYYYRGGFYGNNAIAYNRGRRNLDYNRGRSVSRSRGTYSRSELNRRVNRNTGRTRSNRSSITNGRSRNSRSTISNRNRSRNTFSNPSRTRNNSRLNQRTNRSSRMSRPSSRPSTRSSGFSRPSSSRSSGGSFRGSSGGSRGSMSRGGGGRRGGRG